MINKFKLTIKSGVFGTKHETEFQATNLQELKQGILKRFGNIQGTSKAEKERFKTKALIKDAANLSELQKQLDNLNHWAISIRQENE